MAPRKTRTIISSLEKKGFRSHESGHKMFILYVNDKKTGIHTVISHNGKEYSDSLLRFVKKELKLETRDQLDKLIDCPMSEEEYLSILIKNKHIRETIAPEIITKI